MRTTLFTFGYEGLDIEVFINRLLDSGTKTIVDVRELPLSRKKGFSKNSLSIKLAEHDIAYLHIPSLGCPKVTREKYKADGNWNNYTRDFLKYLKTQDTSLRDLVKISKASTSCLLCFEADFSMCHRTYVAREARKLGSPVVMHLTAKTILPDLGLQLVA